MQPGAGGPGHISDPNVFVPPAHLVEMIQAQAASQKLALSLHEETAAATKASAAAEVGAIKLLKLGAVFTGVNKIISSVTAAGNFLLRNLTSLVGAFRPVEIILFNRALMDLKAVFGEIFIPVLDLGLRTIRQLADWFYSLSAGTKDLISKFGLAAVVIALIGAVIVPVIGVIAGIAAIIVAGVGEVVGIVALLLGWLGVLAYLFTQTAGGAGFLAKWFDQLEDAFNGIVSFISDVLAPVIKVLSFFLDFLGDALSGLMDAALPLIDALMPIIKFLAQVVALLIALPLIVVVAALTVVVELLNLFVNGLRNVAVWLGLATDEADKSEKVKKSAFGLGQHGGSISTDIAGMKTQIETQILSNEAVWRRIELNTAQIAENTKPTQKQREAERAVWKDVPDREAFALGAAGAGMVN